MHLLLVRHCYSPDVTLGRLYAGKLELCTLEEPWIVNPRGLGGQRHSDGRESCVPDGTYVLKPHSGARFKEVYRLSNPLLGVYDVAEELSSPFWGRAAVLIHNGNTVDDVEGCCVVGMRHGRLDDKDAVLDSVIALGKLREVLGSDLHELEIRPTRGTT